jgi:xylulokinase
MIIGLDVGTTGCKAVFFNNNGEIIWRSYQEYPVEFPYPGWAEQDPERVWDAVCQVLIEGMTQIHGDSKDVIAIGLSVQGEAVIPVDSEGKPLRYAILGMDTRTYKENEWLRHNLGAWFLYEKTGMPIHTINSLPKIMWIKNNEPEIWKKTWKFMLYEDFIAYRMTGNPVISRCLASRTQLYDIHIREWCSEILNMINLSKDKLSEMVFSGHVIGEMKKQLAERLGFGVPPLVVSGSHDQACGALGAGLIYPYMAMISTGTAEVMEVVLDSPAINMKLFEANISCYEHVLPGKYLIMTLNHSGGLVLRWFKEVFAKEEINLSKETGLDVYDLILSQAPSRPTRILFMPHLGGSGTPWLDTRSSGVIMGLEFTTQKGDIVRSILEGLTYELLINFDILSDCGIHIKEIRAIGGGSRSPLWLQIKADVLGVPIYVPQVVDAPCVGAALIAGIGLGLWDWREIPQIIERWIRIKATFYPNKENNVFYQKIYQIYKSIYPTCKEILHKLKEV